MDLKHRWLVGWDLITKTGGEGVLKATLLLMFVGIVSIILSTWSLTIGGIVGGFGLVLVPILAAKVDMIGIVTATLKRTGSDGIKYRMSWRS